MTSALATIGLLYDGVDVQDPDLGIFLEITQGLHETPEVRGIDVTVPSVDGQFPRNRRWHQLKLVLTGIVRGNGVDQDARQASFRQNSRYLRTLFSSTRMPADLTAYLEDGASAVIPARPLNIIPNELVKSEFMLVSVELLAVADWNFSDIGS